MPRSSTARTPDPPLEPATKGASPICGCAEDHCQPPGVIGFCRHCTCGNPGKGVFP